ncbi:alpha/beta fold hydrolase [Rhizorhapis sp. SPR117]|uniref:alpha/beta fold hydrolase n=1 Tax=Rhizorhapis sp. SPR117 TaxID=2912611 RepID=UPI001F35F55D|nr:alpha/beta hydrolase [Rhizorhapis sp. SPR117]
MTGAPEWFNAAIEAPVTRKKILVEGAEIETLSWGDVGRPGLLFVHGNGAHADWWRPFAPLFSDQYRVGGFSFSGMGHSAWRPEYSYDIHRKELAAAAESLGLFAGPQKPWIVAHSIGGLPALLEVAGEGGERFGGLILADTGFAPPPVDPFTNRKKWVSPIFATREEGVSRFRLRPAQECPNPWLLNFIGLHSLSEVESGGWRWSFDPDSDATRGLISDDAVEHALGNAKCPLAFVWGEQSAIITPEVVETNRNMTPPQTPFVGIPSAGHHLMVDQPLAFVSAVRGLLP